MRHAPALRRGPSGSVVSLPARPSLTRDEPLATLHKGLFPEGLEPFDLSLAARVFWDGVIFGWWKRREAQEDSSE